MKRYSELSHVMQDGAGAYPGLPQPSVGAYLDHEQSRSRYDGKAEFYLGRIETVTNVGTYIDSPFHRFPDGEDLAAIGLPRVADLPGIVLSADPAAGRAIGFFVEKSELFGRAVLIKTGWDRFWGTDAYAKDAPFLTADFVGLLIGAGAALVGVDFLNVDDTADPVRPAHTGLLGAGILIVENLTNLSDLPRDGFSFSAVPLRVQRGASFPVRAYARIGDR
ncbi:MAG: cyclase family protein [Deltaproteobacteria bacterium]|nr:cyclase family protein [Candidatus Zymogenaceae bacterium]